MSQPLDLAAMQARTAPTSFKDAWQARLERWYAHPGLYRWSLRNPLTRWLTRRRTRKLFDLMAGFVHSQVLLACVRLDLFRYLHLAPADLSAFAASTGCGLVVMRRRLQDDWADPPALTVVAEAQLDAAVYRVLVWTRGACG